MASLSEIPADPAAGTTSPRAWRVLLLISFGQVFAIFDSSVLNVAFPSMERTFDATARSTLAWAITGYIISSGAALLLAGRLADRLGRKRVFLSGVAVFTVASALSGLAPTAGFLIASRVVQGLGAALMIPSSLALALPEFPVARRSQAVAVWGGLGAVAGAAGPPVGGAVIALSSWRWVFFLNVPVGLAVLAIGALVLRESERSSRAGRLDVVGAVTGTGAFALVTLAILQGNRWGWSSGRVLACLVGATGLLVIVVLRSQRHTDPLLDLSLFANRRFTIATVSLAVFNSSVAAYWFAAPLFLQTVFGWSAWKAGLGIAATPAVGATIAFTTGRWADRGHQRAMMTGGSLLAGAAIAGIGVLLDADASFWIALFPFTVVLGLSNAVAWPTFTSAALVEIDDHRYGTANATNITARTMGSAIGVAVFIAALGTDAAAAATDFRRGWWIMAALMAGAALCASLYPRPRDQVAART